MLNLGAFAFTSFLRVKIGAVTALGWQWALCWLARYIDGKVAVVIHIIIKGEFYSVGMAMARLLRRFAARCRLLAFATRHREGACVQTLYSSMPTGASIAPMQGCLIVFELFVVIVEGMAMTHKHQQSTSAVELPAESRWRDRGSRGTEERVWSIFPNGAPSANGRLPHGLIG